MTQAHTHAADDGDSGSCDDIVQWRRLRRALLSLRVLHESDDRNSNDDASDDEATTRATTATRYATLYQWHCLSAAMRGGLPCDAVRAMVWSDLVHAPTEQRWQSRLRDDTPALPALLLHDVDASDRDNANVRKRRRRRYTLPLCAPLAHTTTCSDDDHTYNSSSSSSSDEDDDDDDDMVRTGTRSRQQQRYVIEADIQRSLWELYKDDTTREAARCVLRRVLLRTLAQSNNNNSSNKSSSSNNNNNSKSNSNACCRPPRRSYTYYYFQGMHELVGFVVYVLQPHARERAVVRVCTRLVQRQWRAHCARTLLRVQGRLHALHAIIASSDAATAARLVAGGVAPHSHYALPWLLTWFVHTLHNTHTLRRLVDYCIAADDDGYAVVYVSAALVLRYYTRQYATLCRRAADVTAASPTSSSPTQSDAATDNNNDDNNNGSDSDSDDEMLRMTRVHQTLSQLPARVLDTASSTDVDALLRYATQLRARHHTTARAAARRFVRDERHRRRAAAAAAARAKTINNNSNNDTDSDDEWRRRRRHRLVRNALLLSAVTVATTALLWGRRPHLL